MNRLLVITLLAAACAMAQSVGGPTGATVVSGSTNGVAYWTGTQLTTTATGTSGTLCLVSTSGAAPVWGSCAGSASTSWSSLSNPSANLSLSVGNNTTTFTAGTATTAPFLFQDTTANTGTGSLFQISTIGTSTAIPLTVTAQGTSNGVQMSAAGVLAALGAGVISANQVNGAVVPASATVLGSNASRQAVAATTTGTGTTVMLNNGPTIAGHPTIEGVTSTGATGTGSFVFSSAPTLTGHPTIEGVTSTGATGTGNFVFATSPALTTPNIGAATATTINGLTISSSTGTVTVTNGKTLSFSNTLTFTGTDSSSVAFGAGGTVAYTANNLSVFASTTSAQLRGVLSDETGTGAAVFAGSPTLTGTVSAAALTLTSTLTTNVTGGGTQCLQVSNTGVVSGSGAVCAGNVPLSGLTAAAGSNTIANGNNPQTWNWAQTSNTQYGIKFGETSAATGGTGTAQGEVAIVTAAGSTAIPLTVNNSLTGSQTMPALYINPTWNTTGVVDAGLLMNVTNTASGAASLLIDLQVGGSTVFSIDKNGNISTNGQLSTGVGGSNAGLFTLTQGTADTPSGNTVIIQAPTSIPTAYALTLPGAAAAGIWRTTSGGVFSVAELSGDAQTNGSNAVTNLKVNGVSYPATGSSFDAVPILTASNSVSYFQINGGSSCGDSSHGLSYNQTTHLIGCQNITGSAAAGGSNTQLQYNNSSALGGVSDWTTNGTTSLTASSGGILTMASATGTAALIVPTNTSNTATSAGVIDYDSTNSNYHGYNGADSIFLLTPTASIPTTGDIVEATVTSGKLTITDTGFLATSVVLNNAANVAAAGMTLNMSAATGATAFRVPVIAGATAGADGVIDYDSTAKLTHFRTNGADSIGVGVTSVSNVTAQTSSQSSVTLATSPTAGHYHLKYYADQNAVCTTGSESVSFTFNWTDGTNARSLTTGSLPLSTSQSTTSGYLSGVFDFWVGSGNVTYTSTVAGACSSGTASYDVHLSLERGQ